MVPPYHPCPCLTHQPSSSSHSHRSWQTVNPVSSAVTPHCPNSLICISLLLCWDITFPRVTGAYSQLPSKAGPVIFNSQFRKCHFFINSLLSPFSLGITNKVCQPSVSSFPGLFSSLLSLPFIHHTPLMLLLLFFFYLALQTSLPRASALLHPQPQVLSICKFCRSSRGMPSDAAWQSIPPYHRKHTHLEPVGEHIPSSAHLRNHPASVKHHFPQTLMLLLAGNTAGI